MGIKLTDKQLWVVKSLVQSSENFANCVYHAMENHGLNEVEGFEIRIDVNPSSKYCTKTIMVGNDIDDDSGYVCLTRGKEEDRYVPTGENSPEYEYLFADPAVAERIRRILKTEHPLPPDGLWIGDPRNDSPVDSREWDLNDSLS